MFAVVRIRGSVGVRKEILDTLKLLRLNAPNNCVIIPETPSFKGMLEKVRFMVSWGEIKKGTLTKLLEKRLRLVGDRKVSLDELKRITGFNSWEEFASALLEEKVKLKDFEEFKKVFRLKPPSKGYKSVKEFYPKGDLGYRGEAINELLERMI